MLRIFRFVLVFHLVLAFAATAQDTENAASTQPVPDQLVGTPAFPATVIYTNLATDASSDVPGLPGVKFDPGTGTSHFDRVYGSPNGAWALTAAADLPTTEDELLIVNGNLAVREGDLATWTAGEVVGLLDTKVGINNSGEFAFATNTNGATGSDEYVVGGMSDTTLFEAAQEGDSASPPLPAGATWGSTLESAVITGDGTVGFVTDSIGGLPSTENEAAVLGTTLLAQEGVTVPPGQIGAEAWDNFDVSDFWVTHDGQHHLLQGDLTGPTTSDDIVVFDGTVVVQESVVLAGSGFPDPVGNTGIVGAQLAPDGRYFVRGHNEPSAIDWVYSNGTVLTAVGEPITTGAMELWSDIDFSDCFFLHAGNGLGDFVIGGVTDASSEANGVLVLNNETVLVRESEPIDLDGNGMFDDDLFFDTFGNDDVTLADNGLMYFVATVKDGAGVRLGQGFFSLVYAPDLLIFDDGFESGDTSAWSATMP